MSINMEIPLIYGKRIEKSTENNDVAYVKCIYLMQRILIDEWDSFCYIHFGGRGYAKEIQEDIYNMSKRLSKNCSKGDNDILCRCAADRADMLESSLNASRNIIRTKLTQCVTYAHVDALSRLVMAYMICECCIRVCMKAGFRSYRLRYDDILEKIDMVSDNLGIQCINRELLKNSVTDDDFFPVINALKRLNLSF